MPATRWKNPYTALVKTKPQLLRPFCDNTVADDDVDFVKSALARFDTRFCEIGSGSGGHLIELARKHPGTLCIGFELRFKRIYRTAQKAEEAELNNVLLLRTNGQLLEHFFPTRSLDAIIVNFPDPWAKKRWRKHRLLTPQFLTTVSRLLRPGGSFSYKTDHCEYFEETAQHIERCPELELTYKTNDLNSTPIAEHLIRSEFESLFISKGLPINYLEART